MTYLVPSPPGVPGDVDDWSEAREAATVSVHTGTSVVVVLSAQLQCCGTGNSEQQVRTALATDRMHEGRNKFYLTCVE